MKKFLLNSTDFTPKVSFDPDSNIFEISGISRPEDVRGFFEPILEWMHHFEDQLKARETDKYLTEKLNFIFKLTYFNSSSAKHMLQLLNIVKRLHVKGIPIHITWYYDEGDDQMLEDGEDLAEATYLEFEFIKSTD